MALAAFLASSAPGQAPNESVPPPQVAEPPLAKNQIRIRANEVIVPVTVTDRNSELVFDLSQKDFQVFDNGVEQTIDHWDLGGDPLAVALVLETSSHIQAMMPVIHSMGSEWWEQATSDQVCKTLPPISTQEPVDQMGHHGLDVLTPRIWLITRGTNEIKNHQLEVSAAATGGIHYRALRDRTLRTAVDNIGGELHAQYVLSYKPSDEQPPGFHEITVTVSRPGLTVRTRPGYFLTSPAN